MRCDSCGVDGAVFFIRHESGGTEADLRLCASCAAERGFSIVSGQLVLDEESDPGADASDGAVAASSRSEACPTCGRSLRTLRKTRTAGCPDCYRMLAQVLAGAEETPGAYPGRLPSRLEALRRRRSAEKTLLRELDDALAREDYEAAAGLRDRLRGTPGEAGESPRG